MEQNNINGQSGINEVQFGEVNSGMTSAPIANPVNQTLNNTDNTKKGQWMLPLLIISIVLAVGGIGFGIWSIIDHNSQIEKLNAKISSLQSQNAGLTDQINKLNNENGWHPEPRNWGSTEVKDGSFYVLDANGDTIVKSDNSELAVNEIVSCESTDDNTILTCTVNTSEGEGWFLYDVYGDALSSSFDEE